MFNNPVLMQPGNLHNPLSSVNTVNATISLQADVEFIIASVLLSCLISG